MHASPFKTSRLLTLCVALAATSWADLSHAVSSAELYKTAPHQYGRFEARVQFAAGDGIISSFFLWKDGSEKDGVFWNELDFEKLRAGCELETNALFGDPERVHIAEYEGSADLCGAFHTYAYEWTPEYIAWSIDGVEIRRESGETAAAYAENAGEGMQIRFNVWPGDASFGGNFDPAILPVHQYINWVQYSSYVDGAFQLEWREDFTAATRPAGWAVGNWSSPKNLSTHTSSNVAFIDGHAVLSLTADDALGSAGAMPFDAEDPGPLPAAPISEQNVDATGGTPPLAPASTTPTSSDASMESSEGCSYRGTGSKARDQWAWALAVGLLLGSRLRLRVRPPTI